MIPQEIRDAVQRGVARLDRDMPDWRKHVASDILDMSHCGFCVLGQLFGNFYTGLDMLLPPHADVVDADIVNLGFATANASYHHLTQAWREELDHPSPKEPTR